MEWKSAIVSALCTGAVAGLSDFVAKQNTGISFKVAVLAALLTFAIVFATTLKSEVVPTAVKMKKSTKVKMFLGQ